MTQDLNRKISKIQYNSLNLPETITYTDGHRVMNIYDYLGRKIRVSYQVSVPSVTTPQVDGSSITSYYYSTYMQRHYSGNCIYRNDSLERILTTTGYITPDGTYHHYLKDYQGNNRVVLTQSGQIVERTDYYPYGMPFTYGEYRQPYKYSGKELETMNGQRHLDYGARWMDFPVARFTTRDRYCEKYYNLSPYLYCAANPILFIDPTGCFVINKDNAERYPKFNAYLHSGIKLITDNKRIMAALIKYSEQSAEQIKYDFEYGKGPDINVIQINGNSLGYFDESESESTLNINHYLVNGLETSSNINSEIKLFIIGVTILHEYVHYGDAKDGIDQEGEEGYKFEIAAYGTIIDSNTATQLILDYLENLYSNEKSTQ